MAFMDNVRVGVSAAAQTISDVAQNIVEKNRLNAQLNRLRIIMRNESELINRAYIELGKQLYSELKEHNSDFSDREQLITAIDCSKQRIKKAQERYRQLLEVKQVDMVAQSFEKSDLEDITLACSNEHEYESSPFETQNTVAEAADCQADDEIPEQSEAGFDGETAAQTDAF